MHLTCATSRAIGDRLLTRRKSSREWGMMPCGRADHLYYTVAASPLGLTDEVSHPLLMKKVGRSIGNHLQASKARRNLRTRIVPGPNGRLPKGPRQKALGGCLFPFRSRHGLSRSSSPLDPGRRCAPGTPLYDHTARDFLVDAGSHLRSVPASRIPNVEVAANHQQDLHDTCICSAPRLSIQHGINVIVRRQLILANRSGPCAAMLTGPGSS
ncbi:hypothetical protein B0T14DRAFT_20537 [Immersiella caudata]|uniref:Uncharacterized protein n=1 Tax=Immersiella caudata TaxID=314043 RepID=A0AA39XDR4_9PEZI|nr:hypothetical protein B0T14DRAFT_20537 [Immersiella caudata]